MLGASSQTDNFDWSRPSQLIHFCHMRSRMWGKLWALTFLIDSLQLQTGPTSHELSDRGEKVWGCRHHRTQLHCRGSPGLHKLWYPGIRDMSRWSKFGAHGEHGDVFLYSNLGVSYPNRWSLYSSLDFCVDHISNIQWTKKYSAVMYYPPPLTESPLSFFGKFS